MKITGGSDHRATIVDLLHDRGALPRAELAGLTGLSPATLSRVIGSLLRDGYVRELPVQAAGPGRPARLVELRPDGAHVIGIDAGGSMLRCVLADLDGSIRRRVARPARDARDPVSLLADLAGVAAEAMAGIDPRRVLAAAAGLSGIVDHATGRVRMSPDLPGLDGIDVAARLEAALGIPVVVDNDDLLAAIGEAWTGAAEGATDVVFLSLGYGVGAGILVDGRPLRGAAHAAGAIGFVGAQQLDERASGRAIPGRYAAALARAGRAHQGSATTGLDARMVFERAAAGDTVAARVVEDAIDAIAEMATDVAAVVDPAVVVLGGGIGAAAPGLAAAVADRLRSTLPFPPRVAPSALAEAAVVQGAVALALAHARQRLPGGPPARQEPAARRSPTALQLI